MIRGFFDESEQGDIFLIAGWVTDYETWERFSEEWRAVLEAEPRIEYFKHHEAKSVPPSGQFQGFTPEQVDAKISALVEVICRHEMYGVTSGLNTNTFNTAFSGHVVSRKTLRSALKLTHHYHSCVFSTHATILQIQIDRGYTDKRVDLVFDEMSGLMGECIVAYDEFKKQFPPDKKAIAGSMTEADDKEVEALQAADLLAGQLTTNLRLGVPEDHYRKLWSAHEIFLSKAYSPSFDKIPELIRAFNVAWGRMKTEKAKRLDPPRPKEP
jgi:hypothetical protein